MAVEIVYKFWTPKGTTTSRLLSVNRSVRRFFYFRCSVDRHLLGTPDYSDTLRLAFKETHVFKFADKPMLQFQCQISVCIKYDNGCTGITVIIFVFVPTTLHLL